MDFSPRCNISFTLLDSQKGLRASRRHERRVQRLAATVAASADSTGNSISHDDDGCVMNFSDLVLTALFLVPPISDVANEGKDL